MSQPFKMKNSALNYSAKNGTPINYGSPTKQTEEQLKTLQHGKGTEWEHVHKDKPAHSGSAEAHGKKPAAPTTYASPAKQDDDWVYDESGNKKYKKGSMRDKDAKIIEKAADETKVGGKGTTSAEEQKAHNIAVMREKNKEIHGMSKKELLEEAGEKTHLLKRLTTSKKKLRKKLKTEQGRIKSEKGTDIGQQVMSKETLKGLGGDKYTGVEKKEEEEKAPTTYASPAKGKVHTHPHPAEKKGVKFPTRKGYGGNIDWSQVPKGTAQGTKE